jgi:hypothetical protein
MHGVNYSVKVGDEIKFYLLIKDMVANSMSTANIYPGIILRFVYDYKICRCELNAKFDTLSLSNFQVTMNGARKLLNPSRPCSLLTKDGSYLLPKREYS